MAKYWIQTTHGASAYVEMASDPGPDEALPQIAFTDCHPEIVLLSGPMAEIAVAVPFRELA